MKSLSSQDESVSFKVTIYVVTMFPQEEVPWQAPVEGYNLVVAVWLLLLTLQSC